MNSLSVVIPTHNRCATLQRAISAYLQQTALQALAEIIIVDDGSSDATATKVRELSTNPVIPIRYFRQENKGPAAARNVGIREANSELILFTDDDIIPGPTLAAEHLDWQRRFPELSTAVLGQVTWHPEVSPTPFMKWYGSDGPLFAFAHLAGQSEISHEYLCSCNLSLKTEFLRKYGIFDEDFKAAAYEDSELGYRLGKAGMRLRYNPQALAYHYQHVSFDDACRRAKKGALLGDRIFRQKEAGIHYHSRRQMRMRSRLKRRLPFKQYLPWLRRFLVIVLSPLRKLMDRRIPLPWRVYRIMFRVYR